MVGAAEQYLERVEVGAEAKRNDDASLAYDFVLLLV